MIYRQIIALICLTAFIVQTFSRVFIIAGYYTHKAQYAQNCENRNKPASRCFGRCQLVKKLQQENRKEQENPDRKTLNKNEVVAFSGFNGAAEVTPYRETGNIKKSIPLSEGNSIDLSFGIFHPPQA